jgi:hypothetical protein
MIQPSDGNGTGMQQARTISASARVMGTAIVSGIGSGKTTLLGDLTLQALQIGVPQVLFDPLGTLTPNLLFRLVRFLQHVPPALHSRFWERLRVVDVGSKDAVVPFPIYYRTGWESLREEAERLLHVIRLSSPTLVTTAPVTWPSTRRIGVNAGILLSSLSYQLTELTSLLFNTLEEWERSGRFTEALNRNPAEAGPAVSYFRNQYLPLSRSEKTRVTASFLDFVFPLITDPQLRAVFCASAPGIDWEDVEATGQTVILDFSNVHDPENRRFALLWIFLTLYEHLKRRGRRTVPFVVTIDEFAALTQQVNTGVNPLATLLAEFIQQYMRNHTIWFTCAFQSLTQLDNQLRNTVLSLGNLVVGRLPTLAEARELADVLYLTNPYVVKHYRNVWMSGGSEYGKPLPPFIVDREPEFMRLVEQQELHAQKINRLGLFEFLLRPALREGAVSQMVYPISIASAVRDKATGEFVFADEAIVAKLRAGLAARSGIPSKRILTEQEVRLLPVPAAAIQMPDESQPPPHTAGQTPSLPALDDNEQAFLAYLIANPDVPIAAVSKGLGVRAETGTKIRDSLKAHGLLVEVEIRTGTTGGRPMKVLVPTMQAFALSGNEPPPGRGSVIHRYMQHVVVERATAKGYRTQCEKDLGNGGIVDVHLENGTERIAVEIAIASRPELEIAHMRNCLSFGYDRVFGIFADEYLLERTAKAIEEAFSPEEQGKVQLLPLRLLPQLG